VGYWCQRADERLGDLPQGAFKKDPLVVRDKDEDPRDDRLAVHCFCVCSEVHWWEMLG